MSGTRQRQLVVWSVLVMLLLGACGDGGGDDKADPAADRAAAVEANLKAADFPAGWTSKPHEELPGEAELATDIAKCIGVTAPSERATTVTSPDFSSGLATTVSSTITFADSVEEARKDLAALSGDKFIPCAEEGLAEQIKKTAPPGASVTDPNLERLDLPKFGDASTAYRLTADLALGEVRFTLHIDVVAFSKGRAEVNMMFVNPAEPFIPALQRRLVTKVAERL